MCCFCTDAPVLQQKKNGFNGLPEVLDEDALTVHA